MPRLSTHIGEAILAMEDGPKVADFLGSNQGELARIQALGPTAQILALAKISAGLTPAAAPIANRTPGAPRLPIAAFAVRRANTKWPPTPTTSWPSTRLGAPEPQSTWPVVMTRPSPCP